MPPLPARVLCLQLLPGEPSRRAWGPRQGHCAPLPSSGGKEGLRRRCRKARVHAGPMNSGEWGRLRCGPTPPYRRAAAAAGEVAGAAALQSPWLAGRGWVTLGPAGGATGTPGWGWGGAGPQGVRPPGRAPQTTPPAVPITSRCGVQALQARRVGGTGAAGVWAGISAWVRVG